MTLVEALAEFLPRQRWYGGKGRDLASININSVVCLRDKTPTLYEVIVAVRYADGHEDLLQVPLGVVPEGGASPASDDATLGVVEVGGERGLAYDALYDDMLTTVWLRRIMREDSIDEIQFVRRGDWQVTAEDLPCRRLDAEQSNSSLVYGERYILKLFRKLTPGENPDLEVTRALADLGATYIAAPLGWFSGFGSTLGLLAPFYRSATDGWALAATSVRDCYADAAQAMESLGGDFAPEAERLGVVTAAMHRDLARALPTDVEDATGHRSSAALMRTRFESAAEVVAELEPYRERIVAAYDALGEMTQPVRLQRVHGDLHLGQVLRIDTGWLVLDFEGEPARPLAERTALMSPLRDVAGMLRSFDYAARHLLGEKPRTAALRKRGEAWVIRNRNAFCDGYAAESGHDPRDDTVLLRAVELDKAVYEVLYEARNRPDWIFIPLQSIARMLG